MQLLFAINYITNCFFAKQKAKHKNILQIKWFFNTQQKSFQSSAKNNSFNFSDISFHHICFSNCEYLLSIINKALIMQLIMHYVHIRFSFHTFSIQIYRHHNLFIRICHKILFGLPKIYEIIEFPIILFILKRLAASFGRPVVGWLTGSNRLRNQIYCGDSASLSFIWIRNHAFCCMPFAVIFQMPYSSIFFWNYINLICESNENLVILNQMKSSSMNITLIFIR